MAVYLGQNEVILRNDISTTDATAANILAGKTAYINDKKLLDAMPATENIYCETTRS